MRGRDTALIAAVIAVGTLWGLNWPAVKFLLTELPPLTIRAAAFSMAAAVLAVIAGTRGDRFRPAHGEWRAVVVTGLLVVFGFNVMTTFGQLHTQASMAVILAYTMPGMTAILATVLLGERLGRRGIAAVSLAMLGVGVLLSEDVAGVLSDPLGVAFMLLAAFFWALGNVALKARAWTLPPLVLTVWFFVVSAALCWPLVLLFEPPSAQSWPSWPVAATFAYHVLGPMVVCYALWTVIVDRLPASTAAITALLAPIVGVSSAVVLLGEPVSWQKGVALALVLGSIALVLTRRAPEREHRGT